MKRNLLYLMSFIFILLIFLNYGLVLSSTISAVEIWLYKVFPYLFIMIIINDILINLDLARKFKNTGFYIFVMSLLSGTPSSAYIASNLYKQGKITKAYANQTLLFTYFANPLFLYTILSSILNSNKLAIKFMIIHYLSNFIIYLFNKNKMGEAKYVESQGSVNLSKAIKSAINTTTMVLGAIVFYLIISNIIINTFSLPPVISLIFRGTLEMTQGLNFLINFPIKNKAILAMFFISFGGFSIHTQVKCILDENGLDYQYFLKGRVYQTMIALFLTIIS